MATVEDKLNGTPYSCGKGSTGNIYDIMARNHAITVLKLQGKLPLNAHIVKAELNSEGVAVLYDPEKCTMKLRQPLEKVILKKGEVPDDVYGTLRAYTRSQAECIF